MSLEWFGEEQKERMTQALKLGIDKATGEAAVEAKRLVHVEFAVLQGSIYPEPAHVNAEGQVEGAYGPHDVDYAIPQEFLLGEQMPDGGTRTRRGGKPYMRPSMQTVERNLRPNIAEAWGSL